MHDPADLQYQNPRSRRDLIHDDMLESLFFTFHGTSASHDLRQLVLKGAWNAMDGFLLRKAAVTSRYCNSLGNHFHAGNKGWKQNTIWPNSQNGVPLPASIQADMARDGP
ncbi:hypothetical protein ABBQ32_007031 [Trebouxia sp. C0010 RCD-2024]